MPAVTTDPRAEDERARDTPAPDVLEGALQKLKSKSRVLGSWNKRFFRADIYTGQLLYFGSSRAAKGRPRGGVSLSEITSVRRFDDRSFQVETPTRCFMLRASSQNETARWIHGLQGMVEKAREMGAGKRKKRSRAKAAEEKAEVDKENAAVPPPPADSSESYVRDGPSVKPRAVDRTPQRAKGRGGRKKKKSSKKDGKREAAAETAGAPAGEAGDSEVRRGREWGTGVLARGPVSATPHASPAVERVIELPETDADSDDAPARRGGKPRAAAAAAAVGWASPAKSGAGGGVAAATGEAVAEAVAHTAIDRAVARLSKSSAPAPPAPGGGADLDDGLDASVDSLAHLLESSLDGGGAGGGGERTDVELVAEARSGADGGVCPGAAVVAHGLSEQGGGDVVKEEEEEEEEDEDDVFQKLLEQYGSTQTQPPPPPPPSQAGSRGPRPAPAPASGPPARRSAALSAALRRKKSGRAVLTGAPPPPPPQTAAVAAGRGGGGGGGEACVHECWDSEGEEEEGGIKALPAAVSASGGGASACVDECWDSEGEEEGGAVVGVGECSPVDAATPSAGVAVDENFVSEDWDEEEEEEEEEGKEEGGEVGGGERQLLRAASHEDMCEAAGVKVDEDWAVEDWDE